MSEELVSAKEALERDARRQLQNYRDTKRHYDRALIRGDVADCIERKHQMDMYWEKVIIADEAARLEDSV